MYILRLSNLTCLQHYIQSCDPKATMTYAVFITNSDCGDTVAVYSTNATVLQLNKTNGTKVTFRLQADVLPFHRTYNVLIKSTNSAGSTNSTGVLEFSKINYARHSIHAASTCVYFALNFRYTQHSKPKYQ